MKYARIDNNLIAETIETEGDIHKMFHPSFLWVACPSGAAVGWTYDGGTFPGPAPAIVAPPIPSSVSPAQARLALLAAGKLAQVEAIVAAADPATKIAWNNASVIERTSPTVAALSAALGLDAAHLDALFTTAAAIRV